MYITSTNPPSIMDRQKGKKRSTEFKPKSSTGLNQKNATIPKSIIPLGQIRLTKEDLERDYEITYREPKEKPGAAPKYYNVRKQKICKERNICQVLLDLTPSVVYEHITYPIVEPDVPITYFRDKRKQKAKMHKNVKVNLDKSDSDVDGKEDFIDSSSDSVELEKEEDLQESRVHIEESMGGEEEEEEAYEDEDMFNESVVDYPRGWNTDQEKDSSKSQVSINEMIEMSVQVENEDVTPLPSWLDLTLIQEKPKSLFNFCENVTQTTNESMETYCGTQSQVPDITHVGGRFCTASAYDAYVMFEKYAKRDPRESVMSMLETYEKVATATVVRKQKETEDVIIDFATLKIGRHDERNDEEESQDEGNFNKFRDKNIYYEIDDIASSNEDIEISSESADENAFVSSSDGEQEEPELEEEKQSDLEDNTEKQEGKKPGDDIDGYDLVPEDFFNASQDITEMTQVKAVESVTSLKPGHEEGKLRTLLTTAQKEQIVMHLLNPFENEAVVIGKDEERDVNFDAVDSDDDVADNGEYLLTKYGTVARDLQEGIVPFLSDDIGMSKDIGSKEQASKKRVAEICPETIENLRAVLEKQKHLMDLKTSGGVLIKNLYVQIHGVARDGHIKIDQNTISKGKENQIDLTKHEHKRIPKRRKLINIRDPYVSEERVYNHFVDEYKRLTIATRLIHHKQFSNLGWDFLVYEDNGDEEKKLFPLKKLPYFGSKESRITHLTWMPYLKHNLVISYESYRCGNNSKWHEGYIVLSYPMANTDYDHVYKFSSGVRYFDVAREICNKRLMLVALEDGNIELVRIPFPNVIQSTTSVNKHKCPVEQVMWLLDWQEKNQGVRYQRFLSYGADGELKLWCHRPHIGFTVYRTLHMEKLSKIHELTPRYRKITCVGSHYYDRTLFYIGSEDGKIYKYNTLYPVNKYGCILNAHRGAVTAIAVNSFNRDVFLSGGADGMVKLWRGNGDTPIWGYWLINPIADIKWSPFTSYVWTVVTRDNFVHIYNIEIHFHDPMTSQHVLPYSSCVKVEFHPVHRLLMIADNYCNVFALKINRMAIEPEIVDKEEHWDPRKPVQDDDGLSFSEQRERLRRVLDKNEILVKSCARINKDRTFEKIVSRAKVGRNMCFRSS